MPNDTKVDYKSTLNLTETAFPMRGDLAKREPQWVREWHEKGVYRRLRTMAKTSPVFCCTGVIACALRS